MLRRTPSAVASSQVVEANASLLDAQGSTRVEASARPLPSAPVQRHVLLSPMSRASSCLDRGRYPCLLPLLGAMVSCNLVLGISVLDAGSIDAGGDGGSPHDGRGAVDSSKRPESGHDARGDSLLPASCPSLGVTACLDAGVPPGWTLVAVGQDAEACPVGWVQRDFVQDLALDAGACMCGCTPVGHYSCAGNVGYGSSCNGCSMVCSKETNFSAADDGGCYPSAFDTPDLVFGNLPVPAPVGIGCTATATGDKAFTYSTATACVPSCSADYCGVRGAFRRCIATTTPRECPRPFEKAATVGPLSAVSVSCGCGCTPTMTGSCKATAYYYSSNDCSGTSLGTFNLPTMYCQGTGDTPVQSIEYEPIDPTVGCAPSGSPSIGFAADLTVCCLP
jgi:hypothetical protein